MKLKKLHIQGFKNLDDITIDFSNSNGTTLLVGNNGCGKSNILEAISSVFGGLYKDGILATDFEYDLEYEVRDHEIAIAFHNGEYAFSVDTQEITKPDFARNAAIYLPSNVISCYSGESTRLWDMYYYPYYNDYIKMVKSSDVIPQLPLVYINKFSLEIALLTLYFYDFSIFTDIASFCSDALCIKQVNKIYLHFERNRFKDWKDNPIILMVKALCNVDDIANVPETIELTIDEIKSNLSILEGQPRQLFYYLFGATMPKEDKLISGIKFDIELNNGSKISIDDFSEGEKKNLLIQFILETVADENSLILFDEPDSHIHITRKAKLKDTLDKYPNRENIWTTHSPSLAATFDPNNILGIVGDANGHTSIVNKDKASLISELTNGMWNIQQQNIFLSSNKPITLLVEGKTDKVHMEEAFNRLKVQYAALDFDVFSMNSSEHIREVLIGMSCSDIVWSKKYIGIFDNDDAGRKDVKNGFEAETDNKDIKHVKYKDGIPSKSFYAFLLPKPVGYNEKEDCTIENVYPAYRYEEALGQAFEQKKGHFDSLSIDRVAIDLKNKSKTILASNSRTFEDADFDNFKKIFDIIVDINKL